MQNLHGDIPEEHRALAEELIRMEQYFDTVDSSDDRALTSAKAYVALGHDWISLGLEERAYSLFSKAEQVVPNYFSGPIWDHVEQDADFAYLVEKMKIEIRDILLDTLKRER